MHLIEVEELSCHYARLVAVDRVSFTLQRGEVLGFLGPNGAGKSSTMQMITGNLAPSHGSIKIMGHDLIDQPLQAKQHIGYLPETPPLYREMRVDEYLKFCAGLHRVKAVQQAIEAVKMRCGLEQSGERLIRNLSKGYQQRVGIAQAIIHQPDIVILDEPTVGLDPIQIREIRALIKTLAQDHAVILSTHILSEVEATCDRVQIIRSGKLVYNAAIEDLLQQKTASRYRVEFMQPPSLAELESLPMMVSARELGDGKFQLQLVDPQTAVDLVQLAVQQGWQLCELARDNRSLEDVFVELASDETSEKQISGEVA